MGRELSQPEQDFVWALIKGPAPEPGEYPEAEASLKRSGLVEFAPPSRPRLRLTLKGWDLAERLMA